VNFRRLTRVVAILLLLSGTTLIGYYANEIRIARSDTPKVLAQAWQTYGNRISLRDLTLQSLQWLLAIEDLAFFEHHWCGPLHTWCGYDDYQLGLGQAAVFS
jgi:hypothetical protein